MVHDTPLSKDASTHQIWYSYLNEYKRYALDMIILKTRSEVKVTVTRKWYMTLRYPKMHQHTKFDIPTSMNIRDMLWTQSFLKLGHRSRSRWPKNGMWHSIIPRCVYTPNLKFLSQRILEIAPDSTQFPETRSEVKFKVTETQLWYVTLCHPKMQPHTKFEIPTSNNIRDMLRTRLL